jgi:hypothetical protein
MSWRKARVAFVGGLSVLGLVVLAGVAPAAEPGPKGAKKDGSSFAALRAPAAEEAQKQAADWLRASGKEAANRAAFEAIWKGDRPLVDKVSATLILGSPEAAKLLAEARDESAPAPTAVPAVLKDKKRPAFFRANLALAYAKALTTRKVYEEALEAFALARPEEVVDPPAYLFHKAVCEHALMLKEQADQSIDRLLVDAEDAPERYRMVAALMHFDMVTWQEKDLGWIARKMGNIQRRLDLKRGGKQTQKQQKEVLVRLDEMIKEIENKQKNSSNSPKDGKDNDGNCPSGSPGDGNKSGSNQQNNPSNPQNDSNAAGAQGPGEVDKKRVRELAEVWGKLPEKERARAMQELTQNLPPKDRAMILEYIRRVSNKR